MPCDWLSDELLDHIERYWREGGRESPPNSPPPLAWSSGEVSTSYLIWKQNAVGTRLERYNQFAGIVPRCSPSLLCTVVDEISQFASCRGMELNSKKCKEMIIPFL